ncbi:MAG TPA: DUF4384 domain-containing protein, partial [Gemmatimonadales bacterium]|nr:DUF4384 domain-containing protein [Gemmatimonadales bacterium]
MLLTALVLPLVLAPPPPAHVAADDPPIRVSLNSDGQYWRGDRARVEVRAARDGYLVVLRADAAGRVRVLFPLDPGDDAFIRGRKTFEVRGRGSREAFFVDESEGTGLVLAAWSADPLRFDEFVQGDHWDYRSLGAGAVADDPEAGLLEIARRMAGAGSFEYDLVPYFVGGVVTSPYDSHGGHFGVYGCPGCAYGGGWGVSFSIGFGWGYPYYRPFFYSPFYYGPAYYDPFFYPFGYYPFGPGYPYYGLGYRPYGYGYGVHRPFVPRTTMFGKPAVAGPRFEPRPRGQTSSRGRGDLAASVAPRRATDARALGRPGVGTPRGLRETTRGVSGGERRGVAARGATRSPRGVSGGERRGVEARAGTRSLQRSDRGRALAPGTGRSAAPSRGWSGSGGRAAPRGRVGVSPGAARGAGSARGG